MPSSGRSSSPRRRAAARWRRLTAARRRTPMSSLEPRAARRAARRARRAGRARRGSSPARKSELLAERERLRHVTELADAAGRRSRALEPELTERRRSERVAEAVQGARCRRRARARSSARWPPTWARPRSEAGRAPRRCAPTSPRSRPSPGGSRRSRASSGGSRGAQALRRAEHRAARARRGRGRAGAVEAGADPLAAAERAVAEARAACGALASGLGGARRGGRRRSRRPSPRSSPGSGWATGEFPVELASARAGRRGRDDVSFLIRPNPRPPVRSRGRDRLGRRASRIALALRAVAHARRRADDVFDEIDAGIGGRTAHAVADALAAWRARPACHDHAPAADRERRRRLISGSRRCRATRRTRRSIGFRDAERREELERMLGGAEFLSMVRRAG